MDNDIFFLVNILSDNDFTEKSNEEFNKRVSELLNTAKVDDNILAKYEGNPFYVELNGFRETSDLDNYLLESLAKFKKIAINSRLFKNKVLQNESKSF